MSFSNSVIIKYNLNVFSNESSKYHPVNDMSSFNLYFKFIYTEKKKYRGRCTKTLTKREKLCFFMSALPAVYVGRQGFMKIMNEPVNGSLFQHFLSFNRI